MYPYYRAPMIPEPGSMRGGPPPPPMMGPPPRPPMGPPPWNDPWFEYDVDKFGRRRRKWHKPKPTANPDNDDECMIRMGSICIGRNGIKVGDGIGIGTGGINVGGGGSSSGSSGSSGGNTGGISVGGLQQLKDMFGNRGSGLRNKYGVGSSSNPQVIRGQVNSMLDDVFSKVGMSR